MQVIELAAGKWCNICRLHLCWRRKFWAHAVIKVTWCDTCDPLKCNSCQSFCCYSVNHFWTETWAIQYELTAVNGQTTTSASHKVV